MSSVIIGLGSNIDPEENLRKAAAMLRERFPGIRFSGVYRTAPREREDQPEFLNAVAVTETTEAPETILETLRSAERSLGKDPPYRFGPRTIDLDLLLYGDTVLPSEKGWKRNLQFAICNLPLLVPHPRMHERRFVLEPLCELMDPKQRHPVLGKTWQQLFSEVQNQQCKKASANL